MKECEDGHVKIIHDRGNSCPLCDSIEERDGWKREAEGLNDHVKELMNTVARLEEEKEINSGEQGSEKHKASTAETGTSTEPGADLDTQRPSDSKAPDTEATPDSVPDAPKDKNRMSIQQIEEAIDKGIPMDIKPDGTIEFTDPVVVALSDVLELVNECSSVDFQNAHTRNEIVIIIRTFIEKKIEGLTVGKKEGGKE